MKSESEAAQSCPTLSDPMDCSPPGSSIHGIFQARVLEWGAIAFSDEDLVQPKSKIDKQIIFKNTKIKHETSLMAQWLGLYLPMQEVQFDPGLES